MIDFFVYFEGEVMKEKFIEIVRLDKWFWVVCFYKICVLVWEMIEGGKVYYNG